MLSVLIAIYNQDVKDLTEALHSQLETCKFPFEILLLDDYSNEYFRNTNSSLTYLPNVRYLQNESNLGRSITRNLLAKNAQYPYLLMIDCDAKMANLQYIQYYYDAIAQHSKEEYFVINGGIGYRTGEPSRQNYLRWHYGKQREERNAAKRNLNPYHTFTPFNIVITRSIFNLIQFNDNLHNYGHEDTLFSAELKELAIPIYHIDNFLYHDGLDSNEEFLNKIENSVQNLVLFERGYPDIMLSESKLLRTYHLFLKFKITPILTLFFTLKQFLRHQILQNNSIFWLDVYKLCYLHSIYNLKNNPSK